MNNLRPCSEPNRDTLHKFIHVTLDATGNMTFGLYTLCKVLIAV
jgi:hypothetical protein